MPQGEQMASLTLKNNEQINELNYAQTAEKFYTDKDGKADKAFPGLTISKIRKIYNLIRNIDSKITNPEDYPLVLPDIQYLKVRMAYESGRDTAAVKEFIDRTHLMEAVDSIEGYEDFVLYCRYAESLVAYFKYYGGKD